MQTLLLGNLPAFPSRATESKVRLVLEVKLDIVLRRGSQVSCPATLSTMQCIELDGDDSYSEPKSDSEQGEGMKQIGSASENTAWGQRVVGKGESQGLSR